MFKTKLTYQDQQIFPFPYVTPKWGAQAQIWTPKHKLLQYQDCSLLLLLSKFRKQTYVVEWIGGFSFFTTSAHTR